VPCPRDNRRSALVAGKSLASLSLERVAAAASGYEADLRKTTAPGLEGFAAERGLFLRRENLLIAQVPTSFEP
jgi:hypothetical protein